ncbi:MAG: glycosyltransferase family 2 protein [Chitinophagaceae bacterium]|nr:glycosyltransferase family 2 protein [Chitinophagaceae bacterium]
MNKQPLVSVLMTAYNREQYIAEAIESVLASTYKNLELIIVDDHSSENTVSIARKYEAKDSRVKVFENNNNLGDYPNRNKAASYAKGEFIQYVDSDDSIYPDGLEKIMQILDNLPDVSFVTRVYDNKISSPILLNSKKSVYTHFFEKPFLTLGPGGTMIRRSLFEKIGGFPVKYGPANDMYYNLKAASNGNTVLIPFEYMNYRRHAGQEINDRFSYLFNNYLYQSDALRELPLQLKKNEIDWLMLKNKRRFSVNLIKYFFRTFNVKKLRYAIARANFTFGDFLQGIFHTNRLLKKKD